jgi:hypothetical protein
MAVSLNPQQYYIFAVFHSPAGYLIGKLVVEVFSGSMVTECIVEDLNKGIYALSAVDTLALDTMKKALSIRYGKVTMVYMKEQVN